MQRWTSNLSRWPNCPQIWLGLKYACTAQFGRNGWIKNVTRVLNAVDVIDDQLCLNDLVTFGRTANTINMQIRIADQFASASIRKCNHHHVLSSELCAGVFFFSNLMFVCQVMKLQRNHTTWWWCVCHLEVFILIKSVYFEGGFDYAACRSRDRFYKLIDFLR